MISCQAGGAVCRPRIMSMLISPINTSSHYCAVSWSMKTSKSLHHATVAFGERYSVLISRCLACGNDTCTTSPFNAPVSKSRRRLYDTLSWLYTATPPPFPSALSCLSMLFHFISFHLLLKAFNRTLYNIYK